jgi:hypothetical protein
MLVNAFRRHLAEFGMEVASRGFRRSKPFRSTTSLRSRLNSSQTRARTGQRSRWPATGEQRDLRVQSVAPGPVAEFVQPRAQQKNQIAEEIAPKQEGSPGLRAGEIVIAIPSTTGPTSPIGEERAAMPPRVVIP